MSVRLAQCELFRWFCKLPELEAVRVPGKSTLAAYTDTIIGPLSEGLFRSIFHAVTSTADVAFPYCRTSSDESRRASIFCSSGQEARSALAPSLRFRLVFGLISAFSSTALSA